MRVELVGGLGVGKSTLCRNLEIIGFNCVFEDVDSNPFLQSSFQNPRDYRFSSQMWFALQKLNEMRGRENPDLINIVDQSLMNVRAYTKMMFRGEDKEGLAVLNQTFDYVEKQNGPPDLLVHLKCAPQAQLHRIRSRSRDHEMAIGIGYISELQTEINMLVTQARLDGIPVLAVDTEDVYLPGDMRFSENLAREISRIVFERRDIPVKLRKASANDRAPLLHYVEMAQAV